MQNKIRLLVPIKIINSPQKEYRAKASLVPLLEAQPDLLYMKSLLVSTGSNKNDDVFLKEEMWKARATPILKPVDWEHQTGEELTDAEILENPGQTVKGNQIIGVMYNTYVIDKNGVIISEDKSSAANFEIPDDFHIVDEAVIYKGLYPKTASRIEQGAAADELFVSMEAWFGNYDYLVGNKIVARNEETAFLEPNLKANGGNGIFGADSVKRVLRNLVFGGKGIVKRPANEPSVIQSVTHQPMSMSAAKNNAIASNIICELEDSNKGHLNMEDSDKMSDNKVKENVAVTSGPSFDDYKAVTQELAEVRAEKKTQAGELKTTKAERDELKSQAEAVKNALAKGAAVLEEALPGIAEGLAKADVSELFDLIADAVKAKEADTSSKIEGAEKKASEATEKLVELEATTRAGQRLTQIQSELGLVAVEGDNEQTLKAKLIQAQKIAEDTKSLDDKAFASKLADLKAFLVAAKAPPFPPKKKGEEDEEKKKKKNDAGITDVLILDTVKALDKVPAGNDDANIGVDLQKAYGGLVQGLLDSRKRQPSKKDN